MNRFVAARKFAEKLIESKNLVPPIDPKKLIENMGIPIKETTNQLGIEAYSTLTKTPEIYLNTELTFSVRINFTLAHELGHLLIPWHNGDVKCDTDKPYIKINGIRHLDTQELEANIFASELLMPTDWVKEQISIIGNDIETLIKHIQTKARTSVMACFYALERSLPSGYAIYVKKNSTDYWHGFFSERTNTTKLFSFYDYGKDFFDEICEYKNEVAISQYDVIYYELCPCPNETDLLNIYENCNSNLFDLLNTISDYEPIKTLHFLKYLLDCLPNNYTVYLVLNDKVVRTIKSEGSLFKSYYDNYHDLCNILKRNHITYYDEDIGYNFRLIIIKEVRFKVPLTEKTDPNLLLKELVEELYFDNALSMRRSINGIVASANSMYKYADNEELYNRIRLRFIGDAEYSEFCNHTKFETFIVNKVEKMISMRRN